MYYLARDEDGSLWLHSTKPHRVNGNDGLGGRWISASFLKMEDPDLFGSEDLEWEDKPIQVRVSVRPVRKISKK